MAHGVWLNSRQQELHGVSPGMLRRMTVKTAKRYLKRLDKEMPASTTTSSSASTGAVVEHFLSQWLLHGVSAEEKSTKRLRGQLLMKDGVGKAR